MANVRKRESAATTRRAQVNFEPTAKVAAILKRIRAERRQVDYINEAILAYGAKAKPAAAGTLWELLEWIERKGTQSATETSLLRTLKQFKEERERKSAE